MKKNTKPKSTKLHTFGSFTSKISSKLEKKWSNQKKIIKNIGRDLETNGDLLFFKVPKHWSLSNFAVYICLTLLPTLNILGIAFINYNIFS